MFEPLLLNASNIAYKKNVATLLRNPGDGPVPI